jgi:protein-S-isoprenylcysteine O-methyltransferase Ste14
MQDCLSPCPEFSHTDYARALEIARRARIIFGRRCAGRPEMQATPFEFRNRFWIFGAFYWLGFTFYTLDHVNVVQWIADHFAVPDSTHELSLVRLGLGIGAFFCFLCAALRTWGTAYLRADVMQDSSLHAEKIVADGPYRHVRNPLYLGGMLLALGMGFFMSCLGFVFAVVGVFVFSLRLIGLEESNMRKERGDSFAEYCRRVPRLIPSLTPRVAAGGIQPRWGQAFLGELFMWGFFVAVATFAATQNQRIFLGVIVVSLLFYIVRSYAVAKQNKNSAGS